MPNYKSFDEVMKELDMDEDELKRLVSEGQIRAFRDDDRMKFRSEDVRSLARQRSAASGMDIGETAMGGDGLEVVEEDTDETLLDLNSLSKDQDFEDTGATSVPTVELGDAGSDQDATLTEELVFDETDELGGLDFGEGDADATQKISGDLSLDDDELGLQTEPVETGPRKGKAAKGDDLDLDDLDAVDELDEPAAPPPRMMGGIGAPGPVQIQEQVRFVEIVPNESMPWKVLTGLTFLLVLLALTTLPAIGIYNAKGQPMMDFYGSTAYALYTKSKNNTAPMPTEPYRVVQGTPRATAVSVGQGGKTILWPGMEVIRSFNGTSLDSAAAGMAETPAPATE